MTVTMRALALLVLLVLLVPTTAAAECSIAAYGDAAGTESVMVIFAYLPDSAEFSFYIVLFTEDFAAAAAYAMNMPGLGTDYLLLARHIGPSGDGLYIDEPTGTNVALTECVYGFYGTPILVEEYRIYSLVQFPFTYVELSANTSQGDTPVYVNCSNVIRPCSVGPTLWLTHPDASTPSSFGRIKSLY